MGGQTVGEATQLIKSGKVVYAGSITDLLRTARDHKSAMAVYLQAVQDAQGASPSTKRKWRSIVDEKPGVIS